MPLPFTKNKYEDQLDVAYRLDDKLRQSSSNQELDRLLANVVPL